MAFETILINVQIHLFFTIVVIFAAIIISVCCLVIKHMIYYTFALIWSRHLYLFTEFIQIFIIQEPKNHNSSKFTRHAPP